MIYLNGEFMPIEKAVIPVLDRGFIFGDGVYEVIPVYSRLPFRLGEHLERLQASLDSIRLGNPHEANTWQELITRLVGLNEPEDQSLYLQVTRGVARRDHAFPANTAPTVFIMSSPLLPPTAEQISDGVGAITASDNRWARCNVKSTSLLPNVLLRQLAVDAGCAETLLVRDGQLTEGSASNAFVVFTMGDDEHFIIRMQLRRRLRQPEVSVAIKADHPRFLGQFKLLDLTLGVIVDRDHQEPGFAFDQRRELQDINSRNHVRKVPRNCFRRRNGVFQLQLPADVQVIGIMDLHDDMAVT